MRARASVPPAYAPSRTAPAEVDTLTVGRDVVLRTLTHNLVTTAKSGGARYELLLGPAGCGKTHLLLALYHRVAKALARDAAVVLLPERLALSSIAELMRRVLEALAPRWRASWDDGWALPPERATEIFLAGIDEIIGGRPLVIFVEELGALLAAVGIDGAHQLRSVLQARGRWSIVTTDRRRRPELDSADQPFFGTFALRPLAPLSADDCLKMLELRASTAGWEPPDRATVRATHHLAGGRPRSWALFLPPWEITALADALEPELVAAESRLPRGRHAVLGVLLEHGRPLTVNALSERLIGVSPQNASRQLAILKQDELVTSRPVGRESYYEPTRAAHRLVALRRYHPSRLESLWSFLCAWYGATAPEIDLGGRSAERPAATLQELDLARLAGFEPATVTALRNGEARERERALAAASAAERLLIAQCTAPTDGEG